MNEEEKKEMLKASDFLYELDKSGYRYSCYGREIYIRDNVFRVIDKLQKENEELKKTLKQTQDSWFKDTERLNKLQKEKEEYRIGWCNEGRKCEKLLEELNNRTPNW